MARMWQIVNSLFAGVIRGRMALPPRLTVVALVVNEQDRYVLARLFGEEPLRVRFAESLEETCSVVNQLTAPVVLLDRDWPGTDWKTAVWRLAACPHRACVVLVSGVADAYLWQEVIRQGGYDVVPKPLRPDKVQRIVRLAMSYWTSTPKPAAAKKS